MKQRKSMLLLLSVFLLCLTACGKENIAEPINNGAYFDAGQVEQWETLMATKAGEEQVIFTAEAQKGKLYLDNTDAAEEINRAFEEHYQTYCNEYLAEMEEESIYGFDMIQRDTVSYGSSYWQYAFERKVKDCFFVGDMISVIYEDYWFTMGAHGGSHRYAMNFSRNDGQMLQSEMIFEENWEKFFKKN